MEGSEHVDLATYDFTHRDVYTRCGMTAAALDTLIQASLLSGVVVLPLLLKVTFIFPHFGLSYRPAKANLLK